VACARELSCDAAADSTRTDDAELHPMPPWFETSDPSASDHPRVSQATDPEWLGRSRHSRPELDERDRSFT
jgi:hypothetical protein